MPSIVDFDEVHEATSAYKYKASSPEVLNVTLKKHPRAFVKNKNATIVVADQINNQQGRCGSPLDFFFHFRSPNLTQ